VSRRTLRVAPAGHAEPAPLYIRSVTNSGPRCDRNP